MIYFSGSISSGNQAGLHHSFPGRNLCCVPLLDPGIFAVPLCLTSDSLHFLRRTARVTGIGVSHLVLFDARRSLRLGWRQQAAATSCPPPNEIFGWHQPRIHGHQQIRFHLLHSILHRRGEIHTCTCVRLQYSDFQLVLPLKKIIL